MLNNYFKCCKKYIESKNSSDVITWCTVAEYCDIHLSNGSVFEDVAHRSCEVGDADAVKDIEIAYTHNIIDTESMLIVVRVGDIVSIVERHRSD